MSVDQFLELMVEDPELRQQMVDADSREDRAAMVAVYGIELPTEDEVTARVAELKEMSDVDGGAGGAHAAIKIWSFVEQNPFIAGLVAP